ncbi:hypothetical protein Pint_22247 [Pistacia integerrima]|uniref:Uncharacterized protein n=1 Tax=Pistacia integerrima TaxID=434235 RepID=A0ACC0YLM7_9ROSI|nr:hypothetical protein Pint_22247 [Pistacia integerrima]
MKQTETDLRRHRCRGPQLLLLERDDGNDDEAGDEVEQELTELQQEPKITLHVSTGWTASKTMRVAAKVGQHDIVVLIDSGSTYNFISEKIANLLQLPVVPTEPFDVTVANGSPLKCKRRFDHVQILLQGIPFSLNFYSLPLIGLDLVLCVQWLEQLGTVVCNWKKITMEFQWQNQFQKLQGINA